MFSLWERTDARTGKFKEKQTAISFSFALKVRPEPAFAVFFQFENPIQKRISEACAPPASCVRWKLASGAGWNAAETLLNRLHFRVRGAERNGRSAGRSMIR
jgi:hypothetical protein